MTGLEASGWPIPGLELELPPRPEYVRTARHAVGALARIHQLPDEVTEDIRLAVSEACTSAVASAMGRRTKDRTGAVRVLASADGDRIIVEVVDPRGSVAREVTGAPSDIDTEDLPFERALALPLIRGLVDDLTMTPLEGGGVRMRMVVGFEPEGE